MGKNIYFALLISVIFIVYSYTFGLFVESQDWFKDFYWDSFISVPITQLGRHYIYVLIVAMIALYYQYKRNYGMFATFIVTFLSTAMLGLGIWYLFDASLRVVANTQSLIDAGHELTKEVRSIIYWSSLFESVFAIFSITIGFRLFADVYIRRELIEERRNAAIIFYRFVRWAGIGVSAFVAFTFLLAFFIFLKEGIANALLEPYQSIGPLANSAMAVAMIYFFWEFTSFFIKSHKDGFVSNKNFRWKIAALFVCGLFCGWIFHDAMVVANDNLVGKGFDQYPSILVVIATKLIGMSGVLALITALAIILTILSPTIFTKSKK